MLHLGQLTTHYGTVTVFYYSFKMLFELGLFWFILPFVLYVNAFFARVKHFDLPLCLFALCWTCFQSLDLNKDWQLWSCFTFHDGIYLNSAKSKASRSYTVSCLHIFFLLYTVGNWNDKFWLSSLQAWLIHRLASSVTYHQSSDLSSPQVYVCSTEAFKWNVGLITFYLMPRSRPCPLRN